MQWCFFSSSFPVQLRYELSNQQDQINLAILVIACVRLLFSVKFDNVCEAFLDQDDVLTWRRKVKEYQEKRSVWRRYRVAHLTPPIEFVFAGLSNPCPHYIRNWPDWNGTFMWKFGDCYEEIIPTCDLDLENFTFKFNFMVYFKVEGSNATCFNEIDLYRHFEEFDLK